MSLVFKIYDESYIDKCAVELADSFKGYPWNENWKVEEAKQRIYELSHSYGFIGFMLIDDETDEVVSFLSGRILTYLDFKEYWIDDFSVSPNYKAKGIGTKMITLVKDKIKEMNKDVKRFSLYTIKDYPCFDFYKKKGFIYDEKCSYLYLNL